MNDDIGCGMVLVGLGVLLMGIAALMYVRHLVS